MRLHRLLLLWLCFALAPLAGLAQLPAQQEIQQQPRAMVIDSKEECTVLRGAWVQRGGWQRACQTGWPKEECLPFGGEWTSLAGAPSGGVCMARLSDAALARQCTESGGNWGPPGSAMAFCQPGAPVARAAPVRKAPDANKRCDSQRDCSYGCVYTGPRVADGADVMGRCRADNARKGCFSMVEKGRLAGRICLD